MTKTQANEPGFVDKLEADSLDAIVEVIGAPRLYNDGKSAMRKWFLNRLRAAAPIVPAPAYGVKALENFLRDARSWLDSRSDNARPGWMVAKIDAAEAALSCLSSAPVEEADAKAGEPPSHVVDRYATAHFDNRENLPHMPIEVFRQYLREFFADASSPASTIPSEPEAKGEAGAGPVGEAVAANERWFIYGLSNEASRRTVLAGDHFRNRQVAVFVTAEEAEAAVTEHNDRIEGYAAPIDQADAERNASIELAKFRDATRYLLNDWRFGDFSKPQQKEPVYVRKFADLFAGASYRSSADARIDNLKEQFREEEARALAAEAALAALQERATAAERDVLAERRRQVEAEGWTPEHDDTHTRGELSDAAACYALHANYEGEIFDGGLPEYWLLGEETWKPAVPRRMLVKAGALILAEIERLDRAALSTQESSAALAGDGKEVAR